MAVDLEEELDIDEDEDEGDGADPPSPAPARKAIAKRKRRAKAKKKGEATVTSVTKKSKSNPGSGGIVTVLVIGGAAFLAYWYLTNYGPAGSVKDASGNKIHPSYWDTWFGSAATGGAGGGAGAGGGTGAGSPPPAGGGLPQAGISTDVLTTAAQNAIILPARAAGQSEAAIQATLNAYVTAKANCLTQGGTWDATTGNCKVPSNVDPRTWDLTGLSPIAQGFVSNTGTYTLDDFNRLSAADQAQVIAFFNTHPLDVPATFTESSFTAYGLGLGGKTTATINGKVYNLVSGVWRMAGMSGIGDIVPAQTWGNGRRGWGGGSGSRSGPSSGGWSN